ncbi:MAG TPA: hypothetical protein IAB27_05180 [Candidatus Coprosoma intestinipullorum]|uniref:Uncharacterized protein n=1 Tax=Candidatus Coprosoma intestinipullorum TaxID=2840752 RepID=A0A9D0ZR86_9FIRM|nr:hypothetical protein [Candidatus Coprosoma intestinipullorum]
MVWKSDGKLMKSPGSFSLAIEDIDVDSYRSTANASLIDKVIAKGLVKASFTWNYLTEAEAEELMSETWKNPMNLELKCPILGGKVLSAPFRCSKRQVDMISTESAENTDKTKWKVSFSVTQKKKVNGQ